ncbi:MAG TPA: hypothetical protein VF077_01020 [Nitrospiraceae bacterium]
MGPEPFTRPINATLYQQGKAAMQYRVWCATSGIAMDRESEHYKNVDAIITWMVAQHNDDVADIWRVAYDANKTLLSTAEGVWDEGRVQMAADAAILDEFERRYLRNKPKPNPMLFSED